MKINTILDYNSIPIDESFNARIMVTFDAEKSKTKDRKPLNISMVLDRSGSMSGDKLENVKSASKVLTNQLGKEDNISLTIFDDEVETIFSGKCESISHYNNLIDRISTRGCTNLSGGYENGLHLSEELISKDSINRVMLLTDGLANRGIMDTSGLVNIARNGLEKGITTTTIGVGNHYNEELLGQLAENGGGSTYFIENPEDAVSIFSEELEYLFDLTSQNVKVKFIPKNNQVNFDQLNTFKCERDNSFFIGDVYGGQKKHLLLEVKIPQITQLGEVDLGELHISWDDVSYKNNGHCKEKIKVVINVVNPTEFQQVKRNDEVTLQSAFLLISRAKNESIELADKRQFAESADLLEEYAKLIESLNLNDSILISEITSLKERADKLRRYRDNFYTMKEKKRMYYEKEMMYKSKITSYNNMVNRRKD